MYSKYAKAHGLSSKQEDILCDIQKATYEVNLDFLNCLPDEIVKVAIEAQKFWSLRKDEEGDNKDTELCELVKKYWAKNGIALSQ